MSKKQDDASKILGLATILQTTHKEKERESSPSPALPREVAPKEVAPPSPAPKKTTPVGKSKDPNYRFVGSYLRKDTLKRAKRRLEDLETGQDFSELLEELLQKWLVSNS